MRDSIEYNKPDPNMHFRGWAKIVNKNIYLETCRVTLTETLTDPNRELDLTPCQKSHQPAKKPFRASRSWSGRRPSRRSWALGFRRLPEKIIPRFRWPRSTRVASRRNARA